MLLARQELRPADPHAATPTAAHALTCVRQQCLERGIHWIIDADTQKFFDTISWEQLRTILQKRMNDGAILTLLGM